MHKNASAFVHGRERALRFQIEVLLPADVQFALNAKRAFRNRRAGVGAPQSARDSARKLCCAMASSMLSTAGSGS